MKSNILNIKTKKNGKNKNHWIKKANLFNIAALDKESLKKEVGINEFGEYKNRKKRFSKYGKNISKELKFNHFLHIIECFIEPFNILLILMIIADLIIYAYASFLGGDKGNIISASISFILLVMNVVVEHIQTYKSYKIKKELDRMSINRFNLINYVIKDFSNLNIGEIQTHLESVTSQNITKGDLILIGAGDIIPADMIVLWSENLIINDNYIRGEKIKVKKSAQYKKEKKLCDITNVLISQTEVILGSAIGVVVNVGNDTISSRFVRHESSISESFYKKGMKKLTYSILISIFFILPLVFLTTYLSSIEEKNIENILKYLIYGVTIIITLIPEALPALIGFNLQYGASKIKDNKIIVKNLEAIQDLGAVNLFITTTSGPITKSRFFVDNWINLEGNRDNYIYDLAYLNAYSQNAHNFKYELAILEQKYQSKDLLENYKIIKSLELDFSKKIGSCIVQTKDGSYLQISKGTIKNTENIIKYARTNGKLVDFNIIKFDIYHKIVKYIHQGFKPILVLTKKIDNPVICQNDMILEGFIIFKNELQDDVFESLILLNNYGIDYKIFSSDDLETTKHVANEIGIKKINHITGYEIKMTKDIDKLFIMKDLNVFSEINPMQKAKIIKGFQDNKKTIAYFGNGKNDAVAIKKADVGIVPEKATPLGKQFADILVKESKISNIEKSFLIGRSVFVNSLKYIKLTIAINLAMLFSIVTATIWMPFLPLTSNHLLLQTLLIDILNIGFVLDKVDKDSIKKPIRWNIKHIVSFSLINGVVPYLISIINLLIVCYGFGWFEKASNSSSNLKTYYKEMIINAFFIETFLTRIVLLFVLRTKNISMIKGLPDWKYVLLILSMATILIIIVYVEELNCFFEISQPPQPIWWFVMFGLIFVSWFLSEVIKKIYIKVFNIWF